jgi:hypothetical protein
MMSAVTSDIAKLYIHLFLVLDSCKSHNGSCHDHWSLAMVVLSSRWAAIVYHRCQYCPNLGGLENVSTHVSSFDRKLLFPTATYHHSYHHQGVPH